MWCGSYAKHKGLICRNAHLLLLYEYLLEFKRQPQKVHGFYFVDKISKPPQCMCVYK
jgi:hypothetical protein